MKKEFREALEDSPIIAAIKDDDGLQKCLNSESRVAGRTIRRLAATKKALL